MAIPVLGLRGQGSPGMRILQLGYLPFRYTITPPIPSATMTNANVSVLTSMVAPYLVCYEHALCGFSISIVHIQIDGVLLP